MVDEYLSVAWCRIPVDQQYVVDSCVSEILYNWELLEGFAVDADHFEEQMPLFLQAVLMPHKWPRKMDKVSKSITGIPMKWWKF